MPSGITSPSWRRFRRWVEPVDKWIAKRKQENESQELSDLARQGMIRHHPPNDKEVPFMTLPVQIRLLSTALIFLGMEVDVFAEIKIRELGL